MNNNSSNLGALILVIALFLLSGIWAFANKFNLDMATSSEVLIMHVIFIICFVVVMNVIKDADIRFISILPTSIVLYLSCWLPAFNYWSLQDIGNMRFDGEVVSYAWYGTGWIQTSIALIIIIFGHLTIYYFETKSDY